ncbi:MAG: sigma-54-dependent Fis family transcriptional regulator [Proteobacteria bacterium]|jgi:sigma-54-specific transcriptional regulator|nr:Fis family transcriptional regulator [Methylibium sp.]MBY0367937.1 sigma-54 dependent transcriptional regulator [Burkholderiaceae bacterium]MCH8855274.1 sigma-54-dependent Fis family transcriptional regulator [Pseudomonadota bacterium]
MTRLLTFPDSQHQVLSIRAKALVFDDPASRALLAQAERVAASDATVLIVGETGTGKELIARHIHHCSGRRGPFLAVNCGAFTEQLVEAELFGHEAGAYTGATSARAGWFEAATDGTLFLDEVGDLPPAVQVKLLRVLQERQVVRIGSRKPIDVRVRLVAATNVRLEQAVAAGHFRADLYYRLSVATLQLSNLAQRPGDIIALAEHFIGVYSRRLNLSDVRLSHEARDALLTYPWPGNIRELENVIHYALIVCRDGRIAREDLQLHAVARPGLAAPIAVATTASDPAAERSADEALRRVFERLFDEAPQALQARVEEVLIRSAFSHCHHNQVHTAALLGITRNVLRTQLKRLGLLAPPRAERLPASTALPGSAGAHAALRAVA